MKLELSKKITDVEGKVLEIPESEGSKKMFPVTFGFVLKRALVNIKDPIEKNPDKIFEAHMLARKIHENMDKPIHVTAEELVNLKEWIKVWLRFPGTNEIYACARVFLEEVEMNDKK